MLLAILGLAFAFLPAVIAICRKHHQALAIALLNLFLGWTLLGWVAALIWAVTNPAAPQTVIIRERA
jgi:hypothetical protein